MTHRTHAEYFSRNRKLRREKRLRQLAQMRAAKERKRQAAIAEGWTAEPKPGPIVRHPHLSWAVRDELSCEVCWLEMLSARDVYRRVSVLLKYYEPKVMTKSL